MEWIVVTRLFQKLRGAQGLLLVVAEHGEVVEVGPLERLSQIEEHELQAERPWDPVGAWVDAPKGGKDTAAQRPGDERTEPALQSVNAISTLIAGEDFVSTIPRKRHGHVFARCLGDVVGRQGGGVGEGLVEMPDEPGQVVDSVGPDQYL